MNEKMKHLIVEALEHEHAGAEIYRMAMACARDDDLRAEFDRHLRETRAHEHALRRVCEDLDIDPEMDTPVRAVVRDTGEMLASSIRKARASGDPDLAELVACKTVVIAESQVHADWALLVQLASALQGEALPSLRRH